MAPKPTIQQIAKTQTDKRISTVIGYLLESIKVIKLSVSVRGAIKEGKAEVAKKFVTRWDDANMMMLIEM
jgi:hypothetical protein